MPDTPDPDAPDPADVDPFDYLSGEPLLGPRQAELVHALTCRLHHGPPLSPADIAAAGWLRDVLGMDRPEAEPEVDADRN